MNNDLISRSALLEATTAAFFKTDPKGEEQFGYLACNRIIREFPAVDAVEVVRCGGCERFVWYVKELADQVGVDGVCNKYLCEGRKRTDYCSYGVPREDAEVE